MPFAIYICRFFLSCLRLICFIRWIDPTSSKPFSFYVVAGWQVVPIPDGRKPQLLQDQNDRPCPHKCGSRCRAPALFSLPRPALPTSKVPGFPSRPSPGTEPPPRQVAKPLHCREELLGLCTGQERGRGSRGACLEPESVALGKLHKLP
jgi:hypothetical protein